ncbi:MAG: DUF3108 domain-containing protein [Thiobacillus sp.]|nr:DUF3108 domain-containing protein [Thiobacillus sp.]
MLHGLLIGSALSPLPQWVTPSPPPTFDVHLSPVARPSLPPPPAREQPVEPRTVAVEPGTAAPFPPPVVDAVPAPVDVTVPAAVADVRGEVVASALPESAAPAPSPAAEDAAVPAPAVATMPPPPQLNPLPKRVDLRFKVSYGVASGEQTLVWVNESGARYTVVSVAEATGLAGLFYRGKFVQTSRGRITPLGLQPEEFWDQRGDKRSTAQFDSHRGLLTLNPAKGAPRHFSYQGEVQDVLSLFFQLALTFPPTSDEPSYKVFNGKKLRDYRYEIRGIAQLETAAGPLRTLHLARVADADGRFEVWLAVDRYYLPVRILKSDDNDNVVELSLSSMTY